MIDSKAKATVVLLGSTLWKLGALALLCLTALGSSSLNAQMVTNYPVEAPGPLRNPLMGFRPDSHNRSQYPYPNVIRKYIPWNQIENNTNDTVQKIRDYCNAQWANLPTNNVKVIPRVYIDWDSNSGNECWPADLTSGDWTSQAFKDRVVRLVGRLGEVWDNDPRVAWVQTGIIGYWGEQESPVGVSQDGWAQRLGDAFTTAFHNKKLVVRNMNQWPGYVMGNYWDSFAHPQQANVRATIKSLNAQGRYLSQALEGEVAYNWGDTSLFGSSPDVTLTNAANRQYMIDTIRDLHASALGWIASYTYNNAQVQAGAAEVQKAFGYRFIIKEFACSPRTEPGANMNVSFKVQNTGSAPFYENWPVAVVLINETNRQMVWKATLPNVDIRTWRPGDNYNTNSRTYSTPPLENRITVSVPVPSSLATGQHLVGLSILEPMSRTPGIFFAATNFFKESQSQPLCRIGIGANASSNTLTGVLFNDLVNDDKRYYTTNSVGPNYTLTTQSSANGSVSLSPGGGSYVKDTGVQVTATANSGYVFSFWGGALAGLTNNPGIVVIDTNKTISANYIQLSTAYTLLTSATNGLITLNPPGGIYNTGTVVTVTATPSIGYRLDTWSGDLSGSVNPTTITMNGNKSVTANFASVPTYTLTASATNGSITLNPPGGIYNTGTVVSLTANPNGGYTFTNWSGDLTGSVNPTNITMSGNKSVTANFNVLPDNKNVLFVVGTMGPSDLAISNHLQTNGYTVQVVGDSASSVASATGKGLVIISATVGSGNVNTKFRDVTVPVINWEYALEDDFGFTTGTGLGTAGSQTTLIITNAAHPLAAGLATGIRTVAATSAFSWGDPGGSPIIIARLNDGTHPCLYAYEAGAAMSSGTAPARRVNLFLQNETFVSLNADGLKLFDAAVDWAVGQAAPISMQPPVLQGGQLRLEWVGGSTLQTATNVLGPWSEVAGAVSPHLNPTTNSAQFFRVKQ